MFPKIETLTKGNNSFNKKARKSYQELYPLEIFDK